MLNLVEFSGDSDREQNICEMIIETLLNSNIETISELNLSHNKSWFKHPETQEERSSNVDLLTVLISRQTEI